MNGISVLENGGAEADGDLGSRNLGLIHALIRDDIVAGRLASGARLKVSELALRYGTSTNPVREALHQLQGEGFVVISRNRGARVRPINEDFVRNVYEITALIEPYLVRWFAEFATEEDIARLEEIQGIIEETGFDDPETYSGWDESFHRVAYDRHYNQEAVGLWARQRGILKAIGREIPFSLARRQAILREHRAIIEALKLHDAEKAARVTEQHVRGSGRHLIEQIRVAKAVNGTGPGW
jgi:DNA-binding GntR family transcriptional regulator